jgi:hypothetical protein
MKKRKNHSADFKARVAFEAGCDRGHGDSVHLTRGCSRAS